jgi:4-amino-4-deoxy-L-arabinose transferase-like glycosyltransferase
MIVLIVAVALVAGLHHAFERARPHNAGADELQYLGYARMLAQFGVYASSPAGPSADPGPGREPGYPTLAAIAVRLDPALGANIERCLKTDADPTCPPIFRSLQVTNAALIAAAAAFAFLAVGLLGGSFLAASIAGLYIALNFQTMREVHWMLSDCLTLFLSAGLCLAFAWATAKRETNFRWLAVGLMVGLLTLTKAIFIYYALAVGAVLAIRFAWRRDRKTLTAFLAVTLVAGAIIGGWMERNREIFHHPSLTDERGGMVMSIREMYNHMSGGEYAASFVWWLRGPGNNLARRLFDEKDWHRFDDKVADGFYMEGLVTRYQERIDGLMRERGLDRPAADAVLPWVILGEMIGRMPHYIASWLPLFYRGIWSDEFIVFGLPALIWWIVRSVRRAEWNRFVAVSPCVYSLIIYPALTPNLPRFQLAALCGLAIAAGMAVSALAGAWHVRRHGRITLRPA